jgi:hypothetical protein
MKRLVLGIILCTFASGCVSSQIIPDKSVLSSIRTIRVVPIESPPLILHPESEKDKKAIEEVADSPSSLTAASARSPSGPGASLSASAATLINAPVKSIRTGSSLFAIVVGVAMLSEAASAGKEIPGETAVIQMGQPDEIWTPSVEYVRKAVQILREKGPGDAYVAGGYVRLPISDRSITWHMEHWLGPIRRLYNSDLSTIDYTPINVGSSDTILEIGVVNYEYWNERLLLQVFVRLVDPHTKQVLARARKFSNSKDGPLLPLLENDAEGMRRLILEIGDRLLAGCLVEIGLTHE